MAITTIFYNFIQRSFASIFKPLLLILPVLSSSVAYATYANYSFVEPGPFYNLDNYVKWDHNVPSSTGVYAAFNFAFQNGQGGYIGTQSDSNGKHAIFSIWDDVDGSMSALGISSNCDRFGGEGVGARCLIDYPWIAGREYLMRIWVLAKVNDTEQWLGVIKDTVTQVETTIGVISLRNSKGYLGYGWLTKTRISVFLERYVSDPAGGCASQPDAKVTWRGPYANNNSATAISALASFAHYPTSCPNTNVWSTGAPFISTEDGGTTQRTTPEYTNVWSIAASFALSVNAVGNGTITSSPTGINCGTACTASYISNSSVILTATPAAGSTFTGWSGACTGKGSCAVSMSAAQSVTASFTTASTRLINLSTRGQVQTGDNVMIGGFIIGGATPKKVLVRAVGPNLANYGVSGVLLDPSLQLFSGQTPIASNDDWSGATNVAEIQASGFAPVNAKESAILSTLNPGAYTAIVSGVASGTGVGIVEVYELDHPEIPLINISTRGKVLTGDNVMIGGFIIQGDAAKTVLIRAVGPNLANYGVTGVLANPKLQLYSGQTVIATNDDWGTSTNASAITATGLAPVNAKESAILITLQPGAYTAIVSGADGGSGVGIVEVFAQ